MVLLPALVSAKEALSASLERAMSGLSSSEDDASLDRLDGDPYLLPRLKLKSVEEPRTLRLRPPGFEFTDVPLLFILQGGRENANERGPGLSTKT